MKIKNIILILLFAGLQQTLFAQELAPTLPALVISPDARSAAMGDAGVATSPDVNSQNWNSAKYIFAHSEGGISLSYTPWLKAATSDVYITYLSGFYKYSQNESLSASLRFFSLGNIDFYSNDSEFLQRARPNEFAFDVSYSRRLGKYISGAISLRYINSTKITVQSLNPVIEHTSNVAGDIACFYQKPVNFSFAPNSELAFGATISNLGTKVNLADSMTFFLPMNIKLGARLTFNFNDVHFLSPVVELNKSLVPTDYKYRNETVLNAATKGLTSDFSRIKYIFGVEYSYKNQLFVRTGYHQEAQELSNNSYITFGIGVNYRIWELSASYLFITNSSHSIIDNTFRLSLALNFGKNSKGWYNYNL
jgi:hypothetical protein